MDETRTQGTIEEPASTKKIPAVQAMNEKEYAQYKYNEALKDMLAHPKDPEKLKAFEAANKNLYEVQDAYRIAARLLLERAVNLVDATKTLFRL